MSLINLLFLLERKYIANGQILILNINIKRYLSHIVLIRTEKLVYMYPLMLREGWYL